MPNSLYQKMLNAKCHDKEIEGIYKNPGSSQQNNAKILSQPRTGLDIPHFHK